MCFFNENLPAISLPGRILGDVNLNLDDKAAMKARGLWEDWHLRQLIDHPSRTNHVSGSSLSGWHSPLCCKSKGAKTPCDLLRFHLSFALERML